jgi:hypothetical protein
MWNILKKAHMGGVINAIRLAKNGGFEIMDDAKLILAIYPGGDKNIFAEEIGIFDLGGLLSLFGTMTDPKVKYKEHVLVLEEGENTWSYMTAEPGIIYQAYAPKKSDEHAMVSLKKVKPVKVIVHQDRIKEIDKYASAVKDATRMFIDSKKGIRIGVGSEKETCGVVGLGGEEKLDGRINLPKREFQAILGACEGDVEMELRPDDLPVVLKEKDITFIIHQI